MKILLFNFGEQISQKDLRDCAFAAFMVEEDTWLVYKDRTADLYNRKLSTAHLCFFLAKRGLLDED